MSRSGLVQVQVCTPFAHHDEGQPRLRLGRIEKVEGSHVTVVEDPCPMQHEAGATMRGTRLVLQAAFYTPCSMDTIGGGGALGSEYRMQGAIPMARELILWVFRGCQGVWGRADLRGSLLGRCAPVPILPECKAWDGLGRGPAGLHRGWTEEARLRVALQPAAVPQSNLRATASAGMQSVADITMRGRGKEAEPLLSAIRC